MNGSSKGLVERVTSIHYQNQETGELIKSWQPVSSERMRRVVNVLAASILLAVCTPLMIAIAVLIKLTSGGPAIFKQTRVGIDRRALGTVAANCQRNSDAGGKPFAIYKFRTMRMESGAEQVWASPNDPRVTAVGRFLRKYRVDELPQLFNVVKGDMNLVGPRPEQPAIFEQLRVRVDRYAARQQVLPGITGWAQINHHYDRCESDVKRKVAFDLEYIRHRSSLEDVRIMAKTVPVVVFKRGAW